MTLPRHQRERNEREAKAATGVRAPTVELRSLAELQLEIDGLEQTLQQIEDNESDLAEATAEASRALTSALRRYANSPSDERQAEVDKAETRAADCRKREHTAKQSTKVIKQDLIGLRAQRDKLAKAQVEKNRAAAIEPLKEELEGIKQQMRELAVRYAALMHVCEQTPSGTVQIKGFLGFKERKEAEQMVRELQASWIN